MNYFLGVLLVVFYQAWRCLFLICGLGLRVVECISDLFHDILVLGVWVRYRGTLNLLEHPSQVQIIVILVGRSRRCFLALIGFDPWRVTLNRRKVVSHWRSRSHLLTRKSENVESRGVCGWRYAKICIIMYHNIERQSAAMH